MDISEFLNGLLSAETKTNPDLILETVTGEYYQPIRINFALYSEKAVSKIFSMLKCIVKENNTDNLVWLHRKEARDIKFKKPYSEIPPESRPVTLGTIVIPSSKKFFLNVNSIQRAIEALYFFEVLIPKSAAKIVNIEVVNKIISRSEYHADLHTEYFDKKRTFIVDLLEGEGVARSVLDEFGKVDYSNLITDKPMPIIERIITDFYEGITMLEAMLIFRTIIALNHWNGNKDYSFRELMEKIAPKISKFYLDNHSIA